MSRNDKSPPSPSPSREQKGYQPKPTTQGDRPSPQGGYQPISEGAPAQPPSNPPDQESGGKK